MKIRWFPPNVQRKGTWAAWSWDFIDRHGHNTFGFRILGLTFAWGCPEDD